MPKESGGRRNSEDLAAQRKRVRDLQNLVGQDVEVLEFSPQKPQRQRRSRLADSTDHSGLVEVGTLAMQYVGQINKAFEVYPQVQQAH